MTEQETADFIMDTYAAFAERLMGAGLSNSNISAAVGTMARVCLDAIATNAGERAVVGICLDVLKQHASDCVEVIKVERSKTSH